ncbi:MAG: glycosyltransferase family 25 protein [Pseudomonadota bacterium]
MSLPAYVISLSDAAGRRRVMASELAAARVEAEFHDAVDSRAVPEAKLLESCRSEGPWGLFHAHNMACTISHAQVWQRLLDSGADWALVMEDDIFVSPELGAWLDDTGWIPGDADLVKIERWLGSSLKVLLSEPGTRHLGRIIRRMRSRHSGGAGYFIHARAARTLLASRPFDVTLDQLLFNANVSPIARGFHIYQVTPALVQQGNHPPDEHKWIGLPRERPEGAMLARQRLRRAWYEVAFPLSTFRDFVTGRARLEQIDYEPRMAPAEAAA